jgi:hypothetical protein
MRLRVVRVGKRIAGPPPSARVVKQSPAEVGPWRGFGRQQAVWQPAFDKARAPGSARIAQPVRLLNARYSPDERPRSPRRSAGEATAGALSRAPVTLGHLRSHGVRLLLIYCSDGLYCYHSAVIDADCWPDDTVLLDDRRGRAAEWRVRSARESLRAVAVKAGTLGPVRPADLPCAALTPTDAPPGRSAIPPTSTLTLCP